MKSQRSARLMFALALNSAFAASPAESESPSVTLLVHDYASLSGSDLRQIESQVRLVLSRAGIGLRWIVCQGAQAISGREDCNANVGEGQFTLRILAHYPGSQNRQGDPLGSAEVDGCYASLYATETRNAAAGNGVPFTGLMAYAAAHEIGHLLLGPQHSQAGIMRRTWDKPIYRDIAQRWFAFSAFQRISIQRTVREGLSARKSIAKLGGRQALPKSFH